MTTGDVVKLQNYEPFYSVKNCRYCFTVSPKNEAVVCTNDAKILPTGCSMFCISYLFIIFSILCTYYRPDQPTVARGNKLG